MGGAAGHVSHIWEETDLTFLELKDIIKKSLKGELENITEKLDGQNILLTYKDGRVLAARSTKHLKNYGEDAMNVDDMNKHFTNKGSPEPVRFLYVTAIEDFQTAFNNLEIDREILNNGEKWLNIEILYVHNEHVIPYGMNQLKILNIKKIDRDGKIIDTLDFNEPIHQKIDKTFLITGTNPVTVKKIKHRDLIEGIFLSRLEKLQNNNNLQDQNTIEDYIEIDMLMYIMKSMINLKEFSNLDMDFIQTLGRRWGKGDKSTPINKLLKDQSKKIQKWVRSEDKVIKEQYKKIIDPIVDIYTELGIVILKNLEGLIAVNEDLTVKKIQKKLNESDDHLQKFLGDDHDKIKELSNHLSRLEKMGGTDSIVPAEGIVFEFNNRLLKLTGTFTPLLRILGFFRFR